MYFDVQATREYSGLILRRIFFGIPAFVVYVFLLIPPFVLLLKGESFLPIASMVVLISMMLFIVDRYVRQKLEGDEDNPLLEHNEACLLSFALLQQLRTKQAVTASDLFQAAITTDRGAFILAEMGLEPGQSAKRVEEYLKEHPLDLRAFLQEGIDILPTLHEKQIDANVILFLFFSLGGVFADLLKEADLSAEDLQSIVRWEGFHFRIRKKEGAFSPRGLVQTWGNIGRSWVMGYTNELDRLTVDLSHKIESMQERVVVVHDQALQSMQEILSRADHRNVLVVGRPGCGRRTLVRNIAQALLKYEIQHAKPSSRVLILRTQLLLSGTAKPDLFLMSAISEASDTAYILVIEDIGLLLEGADAHLRGVLSKILTTPRISVIALATTDEYHTELKKDPGLDHLFEKLPLEGATPEETLGVLMEEYFAMEHSEHVHVTYKALKSIIDLSARFVGEGDFPGKAVDILRSSVAVARSARSPFVTEEHIRHVISLKAHVNVEEADVDEKKRLLMLGDILHQRVIGQDFAVQALVNALKRARMDVGIGDRPQGTFLFLGPTGVGKTLTAKTLAEVHFGSEERLVRLDMNDYSTPASVTDIIGDSEKEGLLTKRVQDQPSCLLLLDEIEKAHPHVLNLFLQILDEGFLTDGRGVKTDFRNTMIIATSNAGALFIRDFIAEHRDLDKEQFKRALTDTIIREKIFSPEFLNRFDDIVLYFPLGEEDAERVTMLLLDGVIQELQKKRGVTITVEPEAVRAITRRGYSREFGARAMRRAVRDTVENYLADYMLRCDVKRGDTIVIHAADIS